MTDFNVHPDDGGDAAAYVLGALTSSEAAGFERHLASCAICQDEVDSLRGVVDVIALTPPRYRASKRLRRRVLSGVAEEVRHEAAAARETRTAGLRAGGGASLWPFAGAGPRSAPGLVGLAAGLALVLVVVIVGLTAGGSRTAAGSRPGVGAQVWTASVGDAQVILSAGHGELVVHHLSSLSASQTYEVWLRRGSGPPEPTRALFNVSPSGDGAVNLPADVRDATEVMVTREKAGGSAVPTSTPVIITRLD